MSEKLERLKKLGKAGYIILKIMRITAYVAIGLLVSSLAWLAVAGDLDPVAMQHITIYPPLSSVPQGAGEIIRLVVRVSEALVACVLMSFALYYIGGVFKSIKSSESPFEKENVKRIKKAAVYVGLMAFIPQIVASSIAALVGNRTSVASGGVAIVVAFLFFFLAYVFDYGAELQREADETL